MWAVKSPDYLFSPADISSTRPVVIHQLETLLKANAYQLLYTGIHHHELVAEYAARYRAGSKWPLIWVSPVGNIIIDGHHRVCAALLLQHTTIEAK